MPRGSKEAYTDKQKRKAEHIEQSYEDKGVAPREAEARAWATVNKQSGGGEKSGSGTRKPATAKRAARQSSARQGAPRPGQSLEDSTRADLMMRARDLGIAGRSRMRKAELIQAIRHAA
ncbi:Rho termination factor N-terminal domain-containing protein [Metapseudomonas otitidis]|uniref:Rho termination factor N-terminal domain-containing protein n=1 Tax=Metapseudomonas otitidis TaxID=319939 RepID=UPI001CA3CB31|nr:Rho termination factor N-terminal domain-containing protein [Pseudomonas otitidis]QZX80853.1 Rho termination factor N-terminal domain-containing protein [Pseudomonas otitidis]